MHNDLSAALVRELFDYDQATGVLKWRISTGQRAQAGDIAGTVDGNGYLAVGLFAKRYLAHRLAWVYVHGEWPNIIDHRNGEKQDNRIDNLRDVSHLENNQNQRRAQRKNKSGYLGVSFHKNRGKWIAQIAKNGKSAYIGCYDTPEEAHVAYVEEKRKIHAGCTI